MNGAVKEEIVSCKYKQNEIVTKNNLKNSISSVEMFSTAVLTEDTDISVQANVVNWTETCWKSKLVEGWPVGYFQDVGEVNLGRTIQKNSIY